MKTLVVGVCLAILLGAGCLGAEPATQPTTEASTLRAVPPLGPPIKVDAMALNSAESFVSVSPDGQTVLDCQHGMFKEPSPSYASVDGGTTWTRMTFPPDVGVGGDCETAIMPDGTWVFVSSTVAGGTVLTSDDQGKTWIYSALAALPTNGLADRPWIDAVDEDLLLSFMPLSSTPGYIGLTISHDKGETWTLPPQHITEWDGTRIGVMHGHMQVGPGKRVTIPLIKYPQPSNPAVGLEPVNDATLGWVVSEDAGATWRESVFIGPMTMMKSVPNGARAGGNAYFAYAVPNGTRFDMLAQVSTDDGATWTEPVAIFPSMSGSDIYWMDGAPDGTATLLMQGLPQDFKAGTSDTQTHIVIARLDATVPGLVAYLEDLGPGYCEFCSLDHDGAGLAFASFTNGTNLVSRRQLPIG